jgi:hypothetical protein
MRRYHSLSMFQQKYILFVDQIYSPKEPHNRQIYKWTNRQTKTIYSGSFCSLTQLAAVRRYHSLSMFQRKEILFVDRIYSPKEPQNKQIYKWTNRQTKNTYSGSFCPLTQLAVVRRYHLFIKVPAQRNFVCRPDL